MQVRSKLAGEQHSFHNLVLEILVLHDLCSHAMGRARVRFMINVKLRVKVRPGLVVGS